MRPFGRPPYFTFYCTPALGKHKPINVKPALSLQLPALGQQKPWDEGELGGSLRQSRKFTKDKDTQP